MAGKSELSFASGQQASDAFHSGMQGSEDGTNRLAELRILIVEDEIFVAMAMEDALVCAGAEIVGPVMSVASGLEILDSEAQIDGAILDINLGKELVYPLAEALRDRGVPIIFHTALDDSAAIIASFPDAAICMKPVLSAQLVAMVAARFG